MDPQQRALLERGYESFHDARMRKRVLAGSLSGVFVGIAGSDFVLMLGASAGGSGAYTATGATHSIACGRLSYCLGLHGPCLALDAACSSAAAACHSASSSARLGECDTALAAGVNLLLLPGSTSAMAVSGLLSTLGRCRVFDASADGQARSEACAAVVLRPRADGHRGAAPRLLGGAVVQEGQRASLFAANGQAQRLMLGSALARAGASATGLVWVECAALANPCGHVHLPVSSISAASSLHLK